MEEKFLETYLDIISENSESEEIITEEFHRPPLLGWNKNYFTKIMVKMLRSSIKKYAAKEFDGYFLPNKLYSFKELFESDPKVNVGGSGKNFSVTLRYEIDIKSKQAASILIGNFDDTKKLILGEGERGILYNIAFKKKFEEEGVLGESEDVEEEEGEENIEENIITKTYLNSIITEAKEKKESNNLDISEDTIINLKEKFTSLSVIFSFRKIKFCDNIRKDGDYVNTNRVVGMDGTAYLVFNVDSKNITFQVTSKGGVEWTQKRTANMDPPKPIREELKKIWDNPQQGFGLLGLGLKKLGGGLQNTLLGPMGSKKVGSEGLSCSFEEVYSLQNSKGIAAKEDDGNESGAEKTLKAEIENRLEAKTTGIIDWSVVNNKGKYECTANYDGEEILVISFEPK